MKCKQVKRLLDEFVEGELGSPQRETVERHLGVCPSCREEVSALRRTIDLIAEFGELKEPPDFLTQVRERLESPATRSLFARLTEQPLITRVIAPVGCVILVAVGGWILYRQLSPVPAPSLADRKPAKLERIALVRDESERLLAETGGELDRTEVRIEGKGASGKAPGSEEPRFSETATSSVRHQEDWAEVRSRTDLKAASEYFSTNGRARDAVVALNKKARQGGAGIAEPPLEQSQRLFDGEELALKKKGIEAGALSSLDADTDRTDSFGTHTEAASKRLSSTGSLVSQERKATSRMEPNTAAQPSAPGAPSRLEETQERLGAFSVETPRPQDSQYKFLNGLVGRDEPLPLQPPMRLRGGRAAGDEYKSETPNKEQGLTETPNQAGTGVRAAGEGVQFNQPQLGKELEESPPDGWGAADLWLRYAPVVDDEATVSGRSRLLERRDAGAYGGRVPEFLLTVPNRRKALDEISRYVADLGGEARSFSQQEILARGSRFGEDEALVIILPRAGYEKFQDRFPVHPAERGRIVSESESRPSRQVERRRAQSGETVTFILRVNESSPRQASPETAP